MKNSFIYKLVYGSSSKKLWKNDTCEYILWLVAVMYENSLNVTLPEAENILYFQYTI